MSTVTSELNSYQSEFMRLENEWIARGPAWLLPIRKGAIARFGELGFPTTRDEEWRYTNVSHIARTDFKLADGSAPETTADRIEPFTFASAEGCRLVFVNGHFVPALSRLEDLPDGVYVGSLAEALHTYGDLVRLHLARHAGYQANAFTALNTALFADGAFVHIPKDRIVEPPLHILFAATAQGQPTMSCPRNLIVADRASQAAVIESYVGLDDGAYFTNAVTEIVVADGTVLEHCKLQRESEQAYHVAGLHIRQAADSNVTAHSFSLGGALVRNDVAPVLRAEGSECTLNGLYVVGGEQHVDNHLRVEHAGPHCDSREYYKGLLSDRARGVFAGRIVVHEGAQKTDAKQTNMNLLLSDDARVDTKPQLEILADDVKCTHGATIGQLDKDAIFYLRSRGIGEDAARSLLVRAFAGEMIDRIGIAAVRQRLVADLLARLPNGHLLREAV